MKGIGDWGLGIWDLGEGCVAPTHKPTHPKPQPPNQKN